MSENVNYLSYLISNNFQYNVYFFNTQLQLTSKFADTDYLDLTSLNLKDLFLKSDIIPTIRSLSSNQHYLCQLYQENEKIYGLFLIGPLHYQHHYFTQLLHQAQLIYYLLYQQQISYTKLLERNFYLEEKVNAIELKIQTDFTTLRQTVDQPTTFMPIIYEKQILSAIQYGDVPLLLETLNQFKLNPQFLNSLQEDPIRSSKTMYMTLILLGARAAIKGGMPPDFAHKMTIAYLEKIEKTSDLHHLQQLKLTGLLDFTNRVKEFNAVTLSRPVIDTILFILNHLYEELSLSQIANELHFSASHLSRLFKKEMKMTVGEFIMVEKIEEAKRLLVVSNHSLLEIATLLHFNDQSHFTKVFKRTVGLTPKRYRNEYKLPI